MDIALFLAMAAFLATAVYVILDGFDLGIGCVFPAFNFKQRGYLFDSIAPVWDGNETWLILSIGVLFAAFPPFYTRIFSEFYLYVFALLFALMARGVSFEFRLKAEKSRYIWDYVFFVGSLSATIIQGLFLANLIFMNVETTVPVLLTKFLIAITLTLAYILLGSAWTIYKNGDEIKQKALKIFKFALSGLIVLLPLSVYFTLHNHLDLQLFIVANKLKCYFLYAIYSSVMVILLGLYVFHKKLKDGISYLITCVFVLLSTAAMGLSFMPYAIFPTHTFWQVANTPPSLKMVFITALIMLPIVISYTLYVYFVFRGKLQSIDKFYS